MSVGLDIGSKAIKIVELNKENDTWKLVASGIIGYQGNLISEIKNDKEFGAISEIIRKLHKEAKISSREVNLALPEQMVFTRCIRLPLLTDQEIASAIKWEAEQYIPIPISEAIIQHQILDRREQATPPEVLVLLIASPRTLVEKYVKLVQMAGLTPVGIETELLALVRALSPAGKVTMLLDIGAQSTDIAVSKDGYLCFSRSIPVAGEAFTRALSQGLGIDYQKAEEYKKTYGLSENLEGKVKRTLDPVLKLVADEVQKAIHFYQNEEKGETPESIIVSGGVTFMPEFIVSLSKLLELEVVVADPFQKISLDPRVLSQMQNYAPFYSIAIGLALRSD